jgi:hypothetical protein
MTREQMAELMGDIFSKCQGTRIAGQKEYAHDHDEAFSNFIRLGRMLGIDRKKILFVYFTKHFDGLLAYINGHKSQREDVRGRIKDMIVYLTLLWGMINEDDPEANLPALDNLLRPRVET